MKGTSAVAAAAVLLAVTMLAPSHAERMGAVKEPIYVWPANDTAEVVGWAIANTTPARDVIVEVHLFGAEPNAVFDVEVASVKEEPYDLWRVKIEDGIKTNPQGNANAHVVAHIRQDTATPLRLRVRIKRGSTKYYVTQKIETIPIKQMCPYLDWLGAFSRGGSNSGVCPAAGEAGSTVFCFKVRVRCLDGREPEYTRVALWRDGKFHRCTAMRAVDRRQPLAEGRVYVARCRLPAGIYTYQFQAANRYGRQWGPARLQVPKLTVSPGPALAVMNLTAVATNASVQATFSLSSAAQVQARILNIAGRPVRTLCSARECGAGTHTLVWNAMSDQGLAVPNGTYVVEVRGSAEDGTQSRALRQVSIHR